MQSYQLLALLSVLSCTLYTVSLTFRLLQLLRVICLRSVGNDVAYEALQ